MTQSTLLLVLGAVAGGGLWLGVLGLFVYRETQRSLALDRRLSIPRAWAVAAGLGPERRERRRGSGRGAAGALGLALVRAGSVLVPVGAGEREKLAGMLRLAGFAQRDALAVFLSAKLAVALAVSVLAGVQAAGSALLGEHGFLVAFAALAGFVVGGIVPEYVLRFLVARRSRRMAGALPDALDLTVMCLESGLTFERAMLIVAASPSRRTLRASSRSWRRSFGSGPSAARCSKRSSAAPRWRVCATSR